MNILNKIFKSLPILLSKPMHLVNRSEKVKMHPYNSFLVKRSDLMGKWKVIITKIAGNSESGDHV